MKASAFTGGAAAVIALAVVLTGCGSDTKTATSSSSSSSSSSKSSATSTSKKAEPTAESSPGQTVAEFIKTNNITQKVVSPAEDGAPNVALPTPEGWETTNQNLPDGSYGGIRYTAPDADPASPLAIFAYLSRLEGNFNEQTLLELAPNDFRSLPDSQESSSGSEKLSGFDAFEIAGTAPIEGKPTFIAQKTVVIPGNDGALYLLQLNAYSTPEQQGTLGTAMGHIDAETKIT
jgi:Probable lipoprotein LpqN